MGFEPTHLLIENQAAYEREIMNLARFERAASTFAELRSCSAELQVQKESLAETVRLELTRDCLPGDLANRCPDQLGDASEEQ